MQTILKYRIPGSEKVDRAGKFISVTGLDNLRGFVISSFDKKQQYIFVEGDFGEQESVASTKILSFDKSTYCDIANKFLIALKENNISKAIFSRIKTINDTVDSNELFENLCATYPSAFVYLVSSPLFGTWLGATPELLVSIDNGQGSTVALAGTMSASSKEEWGEKEVQEQRYVEHFIEEKLDSLKLFSVNKRAVEEVIAGPVKHLKTAFEFELGACSAARIIDELHPTPAISGLPQESALKLIHQYEPHNRELYAGYIGIIGDEVSHVYVNLRCAKIDEDKMHLFVGGGFTVDSDIEKEWIETEIKAETILNVLQNS